MKRTLIFFLQVSLPRTWLARWSNIFLKRYRCNPLLLLLLQQVSLPEDIHFRAPPSLPTRGLSNRRDTLPIFKTSALPSGGKKASRRRRDGIRHSTCLIRRSWTANCTGVRTRRDVFGTMGTAVSQWHHDILDTDNDRWLAFEISVTAPALRYLSRTPPAR
ncbi:hypothetical protein LY76DRAFT_28373 [Colletotrichum caudatum]|nr:hypothetical protein LY76DRAFT_28373 [Colletotrichum caudatum]